MNGGQAADLFADGDSRRLAVKEQDLAGAAVHDGEVLQF